MRDLGTSGRDTHRKVGRAVAGRQAHAGGRRGSGGGAHVIRLARPIPPLTPAEQFGWEVLLDLSRLVAIDGVRGAPDAAAGDTGSPDVVAVQLEPDIATQPTGDGGRGAIATLSRGYDVREGVVSVPRALLRAVSDVAGAGEEQRTTAVDRHGRVPSIDNPAAAAGREREPVVSTAAHALLTAVENAAGHRPVLTLAPWPEGGRWAAAFTHDVDVVAVWPIFTALRLAELLAKGQVRAAGAVVRAAAGHLPRDPVMLGVSEVLTIEHRAGISSTWFVLCGTPTLDSFRQGDLTYRPTSARARAVFRAVRDGGHEIGLHGSFITMEQGEAFVSQRSRLGELVGHTPSGVRQHFLRMRPGVTQRAMAAAGFDYDATFGFPDRNGFRLGVADVVPSWNATDGSTSRLDEVPLTWMDRAQSKYQRVEDPARWVDDALEVAAASRRANGLWVGLWHPNLTAPLGYPGASAAYGRLVASLVADQPYVAPLERIVAWRRLRRAVTVIRADVDSVTLAAPAPRAFDVSVLDRAGRVIATVPRGDHETAVRVAIR